MFVQVLIQHVQSKSLAAHSLDLRVALGDIGDGVYLVLQMATPIDTALIWRHHHTHTHTHYLLKDMAQMSIRVVDGQGGQTQQGFVDILFKG